MSTEMGVCVPIVKMNANEKEIEKRHRHNLLLLLLLWLDTEFGMNAIRLWLLCKKGKK